MNEAPQSHLPGVAGLFDETWSMRAPAGIAFAGIAFNRADIEGSVPERFEQVALLLSDHVAVAGNGERWTFERLNHRVNQIARAILDRTTPGVGCVAYLVDHSPQMLICALAALKAGKAYLCIHPGMPKAAQREIVGDASPDLLLTTTQFESRAREISVDHCELLRLEDIDKNSSVENPRTNVNPRDPAVIFYTSGSTGQPKGIVKSHRAVLHRAWLSARYDAICPADRQSLLTYCSFATSEADVFGALLNGAAVELFDIRLHGYAKFGEWINERQITLLHPPVVLFRRFLSTLDAKNMFPSVRLLALAGETVLAADLERWRRVFARSCALRHRFSSTEAGHIAVACIDPGANVAPGVVPAGRPVEDKQLLVVDEQGEAVAAGETGELIVRSAYLSDGYWRHPSETAAHFEADADFPGQRIYRTGDLGRFLSDGSFEFLGRRDNQVKIRGYRVELREVENALLKLDGVDETAVIAVRDEYETRLVAFVVTRPGISFEPESLRSGLRVLLPEWKVPARFQSIDSMPLTLTGKIDRRQLQQHLLPKIEPAKAVVESPATIDGLLTGIWRDVLGVEHVGINDNFFDLGGNSLLAFSMLARIEQQFHRRLPLALLIQHGTVAEIARHLAAEAEDDRDVAVVELQPGESGRRRLFFMPNYWGELADGIKLLRYLGEATPVYGLQPRLSVDGMERCADFESAATPYVRALREFQPRGSFALIGYSYGGILAYEVARQIAELGDVVDLLAVLDKGPHNSGHVSTLSDHFARCGRILRNLPRWILDDANNSPRDLYWRTRGMLRRKAPIWLLSVMGEMTGKKFAEVMDRSRIGRPNPELAEAHLRAVREYIPKTYPGVVTLFRSRTQPLFAESRDDLGWNRFARGGVDIRVVPGHHLAILDEPHVRSVAKELQKCLSRLEV